MVKVAVIGCGLTGVKIAGELAFHGHRVVMFDADVNILNAAYDRIEEDKKQLQRDGLLPQQNFVGKILFASSLEETVHDADIIFEAIFEELKLKQSLFEFRIFMEKMGKTLFFRSGDEPLILSEEQREFRKQARLEQIKNASGHGWHLENSIPALSHRGNKTAVPEVASSSELGKDCAICMDKLRDCLLCPCHHLVTCTECAKSLISRRDGCPICRKEITEIIHVYHS